MNESFDEVVSRESGRLYALCFRLTGNPRDAEDLCQEGFTKAFRYFDRFEGRSQVSTWLYRIVVNTWKNHLRSRSRRPRFSFFSEMHMIGSDDETPEREPE